MPKRTSTTAYKRARTELLRERPMCHWCKKRPATEADHLLEHDAGGDDTIANLVPACKTCNARRGARYGNAKRQRRKPTQPKQQRQPTRVRLDAKATRPRRPSSSLSPKNKTESIRNGHDLPRLETIVSDAVGTYGPDVEKWALQHLNVTFMPWQRRVLAQQLSYDKDGRWCNRVALISTARQQGKSVCIAATIGWLLTEYPQIVKRPVKVVSFAHRLDTAVALFQDLAPLLDKLGAKCTWSYGRTEVRYKGSAWLVKPARASAPHGVSGVDFLIGDELWGVSSETLDIGFMPTQRAVANPLAVFYSTAGTEESQAMLRWREQGIRAIDTGERNGIYLAEWSPPPDLDPMTAEAWAYANPALGHTITPQALEAESHAPNRAAFLRSSVNLWVQSDQSWLPPGLFADLVAKSPPLPGGVMAVEVSMDDGRYVGVRCNVNSESQLVVTVAFMTDTLAECWRHVQAQMQANPGLVVAITPTLDVSAPRELQHKRIIVGYQEITRWTAVVRQMLLERRLHHTNETMLSEHVGRAVSVRTAGAIALSSTKSPGPIELARCVVWAAGISSRPQPAVRRAVVATSKPRRVA